VSVVDRFKDEGYLVSPSRRGEPLLRDNHPQTTGDKT